LPADDKTAPILEIACGYGRYIKALNELGYTNCIGIDISDEQIAYARNVLGLNTVEKADAIEWLKGKKEQFTCIMAIDFLEHVPTADLLTLGQMIAAALKPGGRFIIQTPNGMSPINPMIYGDLTHVRAFTVQSIRQFLLYSGFRKHTFFEVPPYTYDLKSLLRNYAWRFMLRPAIHLFARIAHGKSASGIYTSNIIAVADKEQSQ